MRKVFTVCMALLLMLMLCSCVEKPLATDASSSSAIDSKVETPSADATSSEAVLIEPEKPVYNEMSDIPEALLLQIQTDWADKSGDLKPEKVEIRFCYGPTANGSIALQLPKAGVTVHCYEIVADYKFCYYQAGDSLSVYCNREFLSLKKAYSDGVITKADVESIYTDYMEHIGMSEEECKNFSGLELP